jgi:hypothetical protein
MATAFPRALGQPTPNPQDPVYQMLLAELQQAPAQTSAPGFTQDEIRQRIRDNNNQVNLGMLGQMSGDEGMQGVGGQVFKKALAGREERVTNRGVQDPLTGNTTLDADYVAEKEQTRRGKVLEKALAYEGQRSKSEEQKARDAQQHEYRLAEIRSRAARGGATDAEMLELRKDLIRAQIGAAGDKATTADDKRQAAADKKKLGIDNAHKKTDLVVGTIDKALSQTGPFTTGLVGSIIGKVPGTTAYDLRKTVDTVRANIGFSELDAMRQASPTGGALGQVAVKELDMLQATLGNLDPSQSDEQLTENLNQIRKHIQAWRDTIVQDAQDRSASPTTPGPGSPQIAPQVPAAAAVPALPAPGGAVPPSSGPVRRRWNPQTGRLE